MSSEEDKLKELEDARKRLLESEMLLKVMTTTDSLSKLDSGEIKEKMLTAKIFMELLENDKINNRNLVTLTQHFTQSLQISADVMGMMKVILDMRTVEHDAEMALLSSIDDWLRRNR